MDGVSPTGNAALAQVARRFEAQALGALLKPVFGQVQKGLLSGGPAEEQWRPMLVEQHARAWADRGGVGIATAVYAELLRAQGQQGGAQGAERAASPSLPAAPGLPRPQQGSRR